MPAVRNTIQLAGSPVAVIFLWAGIDAAWIR
jgi:hypothetical protein